MIDDRATLARSPARETALACIEAGIEAAHPERVLRETVALEGARLRVGESTYDLDEYETVCVVGGGKAAGGVAVVLDDLLDTPGISVSGAVVTADPDAVATDRIAVLAGDHPVPSERGVESATRVLELARAADERTLVLAVVTGGTSALLPAPAEGIALADLQGVTQDLLDSGATIGEINAVRKHCSALKGGELARAAAPATVVGVLFSDVVGDDPAVIGSGPTAPDPTTYDDALAVLDCYDIDAPAVRERLERGIEGAYEETPGLGMGVFDRVENHLLADAHTALDAAASIAIERGYEPLVLSSTVRGEAREVGTVHVAVAEECVATGSPVVPPAVVLSGGETTVTIRGDGRGGPNQELALRGALELSGTHTDVTLCSVDTDGIDGASDAAGAVVDAETVVPADREAAREALADNDTVSFLAARDALVVTGPTGTNVNDLRVLVVERAD